MVKYQNKGIKFISSLVLMAMLIPSTAFAAESEKVSTIGNIEIVDVEEIPEGYEPLYFDNEEEAMAYLENLNQMLEENNNQSHVNIELNNETNLATYAYTEPKPFEKKWVWGPAPEVFFTCYGMYVFDGFRYTDIYDYYCYVDPAVPTIKWKLLDKWYYLKNNATVAEISYFGEITGYIVIGAQMSYYSTDYTVVVELR